MDIKCQTVVKLKTRCSYSWRDLDIYSSYHYSHYPRGNLVGSQMLNTGSALHHWERRGGGGGEYGEQEVAWSLWNKMHIKNTRSIFVATVSQGFISCAVLKGKFRLFFFLYIFACCLNDLYLLKVFESVQEFSSVGSHTTAGMAAGW